MFPSLEDSVPWHRATVDSLTVLALPTMLSMCLTFPLLILFPPLNKAADYLSFAPAFPGPLIFGLVLGIKHAKQNKDHPRFLYWLWIAPLVLLIIGHLCPGGTSQIDLFRSEFTNDTDDEGLTQLFIMSPMVGSIGYSLGRLAVLRRN
jgi:hypothetical protein